MSDGQNNPNAMHELKTHETAGSAVRSIGLVGRPCEYVTVAGKWRPCEVRPTPAGSKVSGIYIVADGVRYTVPENGVRLQRPSNDKLCNRGSENKP